MKNSFFSRFTPKEPKFFPLLKQLSEVLVASSAVLVESMDHDKSDERDAYYKRIKDLEREGDRLAHRIFDELGTTFITPFDREDIQALASHMDDVIDGINSCAKRISIYNPHAIGATGKELSLLVQQEGRLHLQGDGTSSSVSARTPPGCASTAPGCTTSRTRPTMCMNSSSNGCSRRRKIASN